MKEKTIPTKVKGTVLYTVISVLMILIVFLMGTLALAATASNRAYSNYQKEQTESTARTVLDSVIQAINEDTSSSGIKNKMSNLAVGSVPLEVHVTGTDGMDEIVTITNTGERTVYSPTQEAWVTGTIYEVSVSVDKTLAGTTYSAYIVDESIVAGGGGGGGGAFVSLGGIGGQIGTAGFTSGGTEINVGGSPNASFSIDNSAVQMVPFYLNGNLETNSQCTVYFNKLGKNQFYAVTGNLTIDNTFGFQFDSDFQWDNTTAVPYNEIPSMYVGGTLKVNSNQVEFGTAAVPLNVFVGSIECDINFKHYGDLYAFDAAGTCNFTGNQGSTTLYNWISKKIADPDGNDTTVNYGNLYSKGTVNFGGGNNGHTIQGDLRVEKDINITNDNGKGVTVGNTADGIIGNVICGGTLTVGEYGYLTLNGDLYATKIVNNGTITVTGDVHYITYEGSGTLTAANPEDDRVETAGDPIGVTYYDNYNFATSFDGSWHFTYSYDEYYKDLTTNAVTLVGTINGASTGNWNGYADEAAFLNELYAHDDWGGDCTTYINLKDNIEPFIGEANGVTVYDGNISDITGAIYPEDYEKDLITTKIVTAPKADSYTNYPTTVEKLNGSIQVLNIGYANDKDYQVHTYDVSKMVSNYDSLNAEQQANYLSPVVTSSCVLTGTATTNIYINPNGATIAVIVDGLTMNDGKSIIVNDNGGEVHFFVRNSNGDYSVDFNICSGALVTTDYLKLIYGYELTESEILTNNFKQVMGKMTQELTIAKVQTPSSNYYPSVYIYGEQGSAMTIGNNSVMTANVRAPKMDFNQSTADQIGKMITYTEGSITTDYAAKSYIGIIGQLICDTINVCNNWGLIYVTTDQSVQKCDASCTACGGAMDCPCTCTDASCSCCSAHGVGGAGGGGGSGIFTALYYNYY